MMYIYSLLDRKAKNRPNDIMFTRTKSLIDIDS